MKKILTPLIILLLIISLSTCSYASTTMGEIIDDGDTFIRARDRSQAINETALKNTSDTIYKVLLTVAIGLAVIVGAIIGIQFMIGSVEEQAKVKETLVPYIVGVFVIFSAFAVWKIAVNIGNQVAPTPAAEGAAPGVTYIDVPMTINIVGDEAYWRIQQPLTEYMKTNNLNDMTEEQIKNVILKQNFSDEELKESKQYYKEKNEERKNNQNITNTWLEKVYKVLSTM